MLVLVPEGGGGQATNQAAVHIALACRLPPCAVYSPPLPQDFEHDLGGCTLSFSALVSVGPWCRAGG